MKSSHPPTKKPSAVGASLKRRTSKTFGSDSEKRLPKIKAASLTTQNILGRLRQLIGVTCVSNGDKFQILQRRDDLMCMLRSSQPDFEDSEKRIVQGTAPDMCPEKERYMRQHKRAVHSFESDSKGVVVQERMVKDYSRSAADQDAPLEHELRPLEVLGVTMDYLLHYIAQSIPDNPADLSKWYDFLWTRTRAIRKDITQQMLGSEVAVDLVEKCARLHAFASFKLASLDMADFNQKMNTENLSKSLQTLRHMYEDLFKKGIYCKNEAEFRSYDIILNLSDCNIHSQVLSYRPEVRESSEVRLALMLATALQNHNYVCFFRLLKDFASFLQASLCHRYLNTVRFEALRIICTAYHVFPLEKLDEILAFDSIEDAIKFLNSIGVELDMVDANSINCRDGRQIMAPGEDAPKVEDLPISECKWINSKSDGKSLPQILCNSHETISVEKIFAQISKPVNSFTETQQYLKDPVLKKLFVAFGADMTPIPSPDGRPKTLASLATNLQGEILKNEAKLEEKSVPSFFESKKPVFSLIESKKPVSSLFEFKKPVSTLFDSTKNAIKNVPFSNVLPPKSQIFGSSFQQTKASFGPMNLSQQNFVFTKPFEDPRLKAEQERSSRQEVCDSFVEKSTKILEELTLESAIKHILKERIACILLTAKHQARLNKYLGHVELFKQTAFDLVLHKVVSYYSEVIVQKQKRRKLFEYKSKICDEFVAENFPLILNFFVSNLATTLVTDVFSTHKLDLEKKLFQIRMNLQNQWLRQFVRKWQNVVRRRKSLQRICLSHAKTCRYSMSIAGDRQLFRSDRFTNETAFTPERLQLKLYLRHFRQVRWNYVAKKYFKLWFNIVQRRRRQQEISKIAIHSGAQQRSLTNSQLFHPSSNLLIQFPPPRHLSIHTAIGKKHLLANRYSPYSTPTKVSRSSFIDS